MQENNWLIKRGITQTVINDFGIHIGNQYKIGKSIVIPINTPSGDFSFNKYRRSPDQGDIKPKYIYDKGSHTSLYGADKIKDVPAVLITEGELDSLVAWSHNIPAVSSTGGAGTFLAEWVEILKDKDVTICYDNDSAGGLGMAKVLKLLPKAHVLFLPDRPGVKDISDYVGSGGDLHELLRTRIHLGSVSEVRDDMSERQSLWRSVFFHEAYIDLNTQPVYEKSKRVYDDNTNKIQHAKNYPITRLLNFKQNKTLCIWHKEDSPSLHYYPKTNTVHCFGCSHHGDAIDVIRQLTGCSFVEALNKLSS